MKRAIDVCGALIGLCLAAPALVLGTFLVAVLMGWPWWYRGPRVGRHRRAFGILKLRTMQPGPDRDPHGHVTEGDERITPLGHLLRLTKVDELPQLLNVLWGDMSLVGPRPMTAEEVATYPPSAEPIFGVRPGLVDWATLEFHDEGRQLASQADPAAWYRDHIRPRKLALATRYALHHSLREDAHILWAAACLLWQTRVRRVPSRVVPPRAPIL